MKSVQINFVGTDLVIESVTLEDAGVYRCVADNTDTSNSKNISVTIIGTVC